MARDTGRNALSLSCKELKDNGNDSGQEPKEKGWQELLEEMFSRVKELKEDVRTSDQRTGKDAQEEHKEQ